MSQQQTWQTVHHQLTVIRTTLNEEIASYPGPITGCDAQFNHLLEQRIGLNAELARLAGMSEGADTGELKQFVETCPFLGGNEREQHT